MENNLSHTAKQIVFSLLLVIGIASICFLFKNELGYIVVALVLMVVVSSIAIFFDTIPVVLAAILSALLWNIFFFPPIYTLHIDATEDIVIFLVYFLIALTKILYSYRVRKARKEAKEKEEKQYTLNLYNTLFNSLSHELRTPLSTILASTDTLQYNMEQLTDGQKKSLLEQIIIASNRLNQQIDNLLNMSRLESGTLQLNKTWSDINDLLSDTLNKMENKELHQVKFTPNETLPLVKIDAGILQQVIHNIIYNALKYTPPTSTITINAKMNDNDLLSIQIADDGPGVQEEELPLLFEKFYRAPQTKTGGTGLGLSIAKGYAEAHGGYIEAKHNSPQGLIISITLPVEASYINKLKNE